MKNDFVVYFEKRTIYSAAVKQAAREIMRDYPQLDIHFEAKFLDEDFTEEELIPIVDSNYHFGSYPVVMKNGKYFGGASEFLLEYKRLKKLAPTIK